MNRFLAKGFAGVSVVGWANPQLVCNSCYICNKRAFEMNVDEAILKCLDDFVVLGNDFNEGNKEKVRASFEELRDVFKNYTEKYIKEEYREGLWKGLLKVLKSGNYSHANDRFPTDWTDDKEFDRRFKELWWLNGKGFRNAASKFVYMNFIKTRDQEKAADFINGLLG